MKTVIFTYDKAPPGRIQNAKTLKEQLNAEVFIGGSDTVKNLVDLCKQFNDSLLILEDDVELCNNFNELTSLVISKYNDSVINFHYNCLPKSSNVETFNGLKLIRTDGSNYIWNQCFFLPNSVRKLIVENEEEFRRSYPYYVRTKQQDVYIAYCIRDSEFIAVYPSLVRHLDFGSTIRDSKSSKTLFQVN